LEQYQVLASRVLACRAGGGIQLKAQTFVQWMEDVKLAVRIKQRKVGLAGQQSATLWPLI
jgi:hypothetical protein